MSNIDILAKLNQSIKAVTVSTLGSSVLQPEYFNQFVQEATQDLSILPEARLIPMDSDKVNIDRTGFGARVLQKVNENTEISSASDPSFHQNQLVAEEFVAMAQLTDQSLRRNIEKANFEATLVSMLSQQAGVDWEEYAVFADSSLYTAPSVPVLHAGDGWIAKADDDQKIYGTGAGKAFDYSANGVTGMFKEMVDTYPKKYFKQPAQHRIYCGWTDFDGYRDELASRETGLGDAALSQALELNYKGIPVKYAPVLDSTDGVTAMTRPAILVNPNNLVYGILEDITIEPDRIPKARRTDFVLGMEIDQHFENETAVVVAFPEGTKPA